MTAWCWCILIASWFIALFLYFNRRLNDYFNTSLVPAVGVFINMIGNAFVMELYNVSSNSTLTELKIIFVISGIVGAVGAVVWVVRLLDFSFSFADSEEICVFIPICIVCILISVAWFCLGYNVMEQEIYDTNIVVEEVVETTDVPIYATTFANMTTGEIEGSGGILRGFVISGYVDSVPVYRYHYRNEYGALVTDYVPADKNISMIFDTLTEGEQPYLRIISTYEVKTDNNVELSDVQKTLIKRIYQFYIPVNSFSENFRF